MTYSVISTFPKNAWPRALDTGKACKPLASRNLRMKYGEALRNFSNPS